MDTRGHRVPGLLLGVDAMTGLYSCAIAHLAKLYGPPELVYAGAFEAVVAMFPDYEPTEIAGDVVKQRQINVRSPLIIDPALFADLADKEKK